MDLELLIRLSARIRALTEQQFLALRDMIEHGNEQEEHVPAVSQCLSDCIDISEAYQRGWRIIPQVAAVA
jgi:hypothetical protein